jgi:hypothetical protein
VTEVSVARWTNSTSTRKCVRRSSLEQAVSTQAPGNSTVGPVLPPDTHEHHEPPHRVMVEHFDPNDYDEGVAGSAPWVITINAAVAGFSLSFEEALLRARSFFLSDFKKELDGLLGSEDSE